MMTPDDKAVLKAMGIDDAWIAMGFATPEVVSRAREEAAKQNGTAHPEHVRYFAVKQMLTRTQEISADCFHGLLELMWDEPDRVFATSTLQLIAEHHGLQAEHLRILVDIAPKSVRKAICRVELMRRLQAEGLSEAIVDEAVRSKDAQIQAAIIKAASTDRLTMQKLADAGANRAIRNQAAHRLQGKGV